MFFDLALTYDPQTRRCDLALGADCDLVIDETPLPAMLLSVGLDRRAGPDDPLPEGRSQFLAPASFCERRGCIGDALDPFGALTGTKAWLLDRAKATETTRALYQFWLEESLAWVEDETGTPAKVEVEWIDRDKLRYRIQVLNTALTLSRRMEG